MDSIDKLVKKLSLLGDQIEYNKNNIVIVKDGDKYKCYTENNNRIQSITLDSIKKILSNKNNTIILAESEGNWLIIDKSFTKIAVFKHEKIVNTAENIIILKGKNTGAYRICSIFGELICCDTFRWIKILKTNYGILVYGINSASGIVLGIVEKNKILPIVNHNTSITDKVYIGSSSIAIADEKNTVRVFKIAKESKDKYTINLDIVVKDGNVELKTWSISPHFVVKDNFRNVIINFVAAELLF